MAHLLRFFLICSVLLGAGGAWADTTWVVPGPVSGLWEAADSPYMITGHVQILAGDRLEIGAGVTVYFAGYCRVLVQGTLITVGTHDAPVLMTTDTVANPLGWAGIWLDEPSEASDLSYTVLENGRVDGTGDWALGGALLVDGAQLFMTGCTIRSCRAVTGHGIYARDGAQLTLTECWVYGNGSGNGGGGAINCQGGTTLTLERSLITQNLALYGGGLNIENSTAQIRDTEISKNTALVWGGGVFCREATVTMTGTTLATNGSMGGGGLDGRIATDLVMDSCLVIGNAAMRPGAQGWGGGLNLQGGQQDLTRVTFVGNLAPAGAALNCGPETAIRNCIFAFHGAGGGLQFNYPGASIRYCCFGGNANGDLMGPQVPPGMGVLSRVNLNGDSCDSYFNLFTDPEFDPEAGLSFALASTSPCVDAGDPALPHDADGTIADIGMRPMLHNITMALTPWTELPENSALAPAFPNPFNPATTLRWELAQPAVVSLRIYDMLGREVATLFAGRQPAGVFTQRWDASALPSGTYIALLTAGDVRAAQKLVLAK